MNLAGARSADRWVQALSKLCLREVILMNWISENHLDAKLLERIDRSLLDVAYLEDDPILVAWVEKHNAGLVELGQRFQRLAADRAVRDHSEDWFDRTSKAVRNAYRRLVDESWDVLATLRSALNERQSLLQHLENYVARKIAELTEQREKAFTKAQRALAREHSAYLREAPVQGQAYVDDLAEYDDGIIEFDEQIASWQAIFERLSSLRYKAGTDVSSLSFRQREVMEHLAV